MSAIIPCELCGESYDTGGPEHECRPNDRIDLLEGRIEDLEERIERLERNLTTAAIAGAGAGDDLRR